MNTSLGVGGKEGGAGERERRGREVGRRIS